MINKVLSQGQDGNDFLEGGELDDILYGGGGTDTLSGKAGADYLDGGVGNDHLLGGQGNDTLLGGSGFDRARYFVEGNLTANLGSVVGEGVDTLKSIEVVYVTGGDNAQTFNASNFEGKVIFDGQGGDDTLIGSAGDDTLLGRFGNDLIVGGDGIDLLKGGPGFDTLAGGAGNDHLLGGQGNDTLLGGSGFDRARYFVEGNLTANQGSVVGEGVDTLNSIEVVYVTGGDNAQIFNATNFEGKVIFDGQDGNDTLIGSAGDDTLLGRFGNDLILGGDGIDLLKGGPGLDTLAGGAGNDHLLGGQGNDTLLGGSGFDRARYFVEGNLTANQGSVVGEGVDTLKSIEVVYVTGGDNAQTFNAKNFEGKVIFDGQGGDDTLIGSAGDDTLLGRFGNDRIIGGAGDDIIEGDRGFDTLTGGAGKDTFVLQSLQGFDSITDFKVGEDKLKLIDIDFSDLSINSYQGSGSVIRSNSGGVLAVLTDVQVNSLSQSDLIFA